MKARTLVPLIIIIVGVGLALAGFAAGGAKAFWYGASSAPAAPSAPDAPSAPNAPDAPVAPEPPEPRGFWGGMKGFWFDRGGLFGNRNPGALIEVNESYDGFTDVVLSADYLGSITFREGDGYAVRGRNYERLGGLDVNLESGRLYVDATRDERWLRYGISDFRGWNDRDSWIEITYPKGAKLGLVSANISAGQVSAGGIECDELDFDNDFGDVGLRDVAAGKLNLSLNAGNARIDNATADTIVISNDFGRIDLKNITADSLDLKLSSGDLYANSVNTRDLFAKNDFGVIKLESLTLSGRAEIGQNAGDVFLSMDMNEADLSYELSTTAGSVSIDGKSSGASVYSRNASAGSNLSVSSDFGNITLKFLQ